MKVAVDGSCWGGQERGVAVATRRLWSASTAFDSVARATVFARADLRGHSPDATVIPVGPFAGGARVAWQQTRLPQLLREHAIELLYCPSYTAPVGARCRTVATVHDLIAWTHPELAGFLNTVHLRALVGRTVRTASAVCVPTEVVARQVIDRFAITSRKVFVVPWGVDVDLVAQAPAHAKLHVERRFGVRQPFALFCGCLEAKKNLSAAADAASDAGILLVAVGPWIAESAYVLARASSGRRRCRYLGYVSTQDLGALYSAATALIFPSLAEGFGMPTAEAMHCRCPVVANDLPSLREVCGGAALYAAVGDNVALAGALRQIVRDDGLRDELIARGTERAAQLTWSASADRFDEALRYAQRN